MTDILKGRVWKFGDDINTELMIPAVALAKPEKEAAKYFFSANRPGCVEMVENGDIIVNEINTIPGFTKISMYPKLWEASGISFTELIDRLVKLAIERFEEEKKLKTSYK